MEPKIIQQHNISYEINENELTAEVTYSPNTKGTIFFPQSIEYESHEYKITNIKEGSFKDNINIKSIEISDQSEIKTISKNAFSRSTIRNLVIPSQVDTLEDGWCHNTFKLILVSISPSNKNFKYLDDEHQIIIGKSDTKGDIFDTIVFANRGIQRATIPKFIKYIRPYAFQNCNQLKTLEIQKDSELVSIFEKAFSTTSIDSFFISHNVENLKDGWCKNINNLNSVTISPSNKNFRYLDDEHQIIIGKSDTNGDIFDTIVFANRSIQRATIPKFIKYIKPYAFEYCKKLNAIEFSEDSEIVSIGKNAFRLTCIESICIPSSLEEWSAYDSNLKKITVSPSNKNFGYLDDKHQIIVEKSDIESDVFDTIVFANRDIEKATIPKFIKYIKPYAFFKCKKLNQVDFSANSELLIIGKYAFSRAHIIMIKIPKSVIDIGKFAFSHCDQLIKVSLEEGSNLISLQKRTFGDNDNLTTFEIPSDSKLQNICSLVFTFSKVETIFIPENVSKIDTKWCFLSSLLNVVVSPSNKHFKYLDERRQIIIGKSDTKSDIFDTIVFVDRSSTYITIPNFIKYIYSSAFENCDYLRGIKIPDDSELDTIPDYFANDSIKSIFIPRNVERMKSRWCCKSSKLTNVIISPFNKNFKYLDDEHQIIIGKSDTKSDMFDTIMFASRNIQRATIPKNIKHIKGYAFDNCEQLKSLEIQKDSDLEKIGKFAFSKSSLKSIIIPKSVSKISRGLFFSCDFLSNVSFEEGSKLQSLGSDLFFSCKRLNEVDIPENSSLRVIENDIFDFSSVKTLFIPKNLEIIENGLSRFSKIKKIIISPLNPNFGYLDEKHQVVVGKSNNKEKIFDTVIFADRNIEHVSIPKFIKFIHTAAFMECEKLKRIDIPDDSEIESIGEKAFFSTSLVNFKFPRKICKYANEILSACRKIRFIEFLGDEFIDDENRSIFIELQSLILASFPNIQRFSVPSKKDTFKFSEDFTLFINPGVDVNLHNVRESSKKHVSDDDSYSD
ncbi:hypothetical protein M9Y10_042696 [Tritrichomonas musculus]|uniref:Surface antigen BspA-like n=1 Tax=Tritrichomonas musculus TaxID=1915356 RepID=A0ABR2JY07_9EUKA